MCRRNHALFMMEMFIAQELGKALKDLEAEQSVLLEEAKRQLLRQTK